MERVVGRTELGVQRVHIVLRIERVGRVLEEELTQALMQ